MIFRERERERRINMKKMSTYCHSSFVQVCIHFGSYTYKRESISPLFHIYN